ncbi:MAG: hypothetical protein ACJ8C4_12575 [Gemmataceae bacterium]
MKFSTRKILESWTFPDPPAPPSQFRLGLMGAIFVAIVAGTAGALPGVLVAIGVTHNNPQAMRVRQLIERREPAGTYMAPRELAGWSAALGSAGGIIGGTIGWLAGGFRQPSTLRVFAAAAGATWAFDGAVFGVVRFGLPGVLLGSLFAAAILTFVGASLGRWAFLLLIKPLAWLVVPHF